MRRFLPQTLPVWVLLIVIAGLLISQVATLYIVSRDRAAANDIVDLYRLNDRAFSLVQLMHDATPEQRKTTATGLFNSTYALTVSDTPDETYRAFWRLDAARGDQPAPVVPISSVTEEWQIVASGRAIAVTGASLARYLPLSTVSCVPITDWPGSTVAAAWRSGEGSALVAQFVRVAASVRDAEPDLIGSIEHPDVSADQV